MSTTIDERMDWTIEENANQAIQIDYLEQARLQDAKDHEQAMRVLITILSKRCDIIRNLQSRADNWQDVATEANRKIKTLESSFRDFTHKGPGYVRLGADEFEFKPLTRW